jgi:hypothetical protein
MPKSEDALEVEKIHAGLYQQILDNLEGAKGKMFKKVD